MTYLKQVRLVREDGPDRRSHLLTFIEAELAVEDAPLNVQRWKDGPWESGWRATETKGTRWDAWWEDERGNRRPCFRVTPVRRAACGG